MNQTDVGKRWLWLVLIVALALRLLLALGVQIQVSKTPGRLCLISGDAEGYWELAGKLVAGEAYSIHNPPRYLLRMPGFPLLLALPRFLFGASPFAARLVLAFVGTAACGLTYWLGRELVGPTVGLIACAYTAISPTMLLFSVLFLSETAFAAALLASLVAAAKLVRHLAPVSDNRSVCRFSPQGLGAETPNAPKIEPLQGTYLLMAITTGLLIGLATYMRPTWILVGPGLGICLVLFGRVPMLSRWILAGCVCVGLAVMLAPWTVRNFSVTGHFIPTTLWVGPSLYDGLNPMAAGDSDMTFFDQEQLMQKQKLSEYEMDREYRRRAWDFVKAQPGRVLSLALVKQSRYWSPAPNSDQFKNPVVHVIAWLAFVPLVVFALFGAWFSRRDVWLLMLTAAPIIYFAALHLLFVGSLRYRLPAEYPLAVLAAVGLCRLWPSVRCELPTEKIQDPVVS